MGERTMFRIIVATLAALAIAGPADAAGKRKRTKVRHVAPIAAAPAAPYGTPRPVWAQPWECYTDEGYGRYLPCGTGKDN